MADNTAPAQPAAPTGVGGAPNVPPAPSPGGTPSDAGRLGGLSELERATALAAFDDFTVPTVPLSNPAGPAITGQPSSSAPAPPDGLQPTTPAQGGETPASPFDEELAALTPEGVAAQPTIPDLSTDEAIQKALNPTGQVAETEQLKHAQKFIGRQSAEIRAARQTVEQFTKLLEPVLSRDAQGNAIGIDLLKLGDALGQDAVNAALESRGLKLVPREWGPEQAALEKDYPRDLVDQLVPQQDMSFEEKVELIKSDVEKLVDLRSAKRERELVRAHQAQQQAAADREAIRHRLDHYRKTDKTFEHLAKRSADDIPDSLLDKANARLPLAITGELRAQLVYELAKLARLSDPGVRKAMADTIREHVEQEIMQKFSLSAPVGGGGVLPAGGSRRGAGGGDSEFAPLAGAVEAFG